MVVVDAAETELRSLLAPFLARSIELDWVVVAGICEFWVNRSTEEIPSRNRARNSILALLNMPSLRETTINWEPLNR